MMSDSGPQPNAQMLQDHVSMVFLHHLMDAPLVRGKRSWTVWWWGGGTGEGFGTLSSLRYLIWKD